MSQSFGMDRIHKIVLSLYKELKKICEENNLRYFAISGTTIGAVLWNGIIPWDDDIDIALPAEDYAKFIKLCKEGALSKHTKFIEYIWFGSKIYDDRTMFTNVYYLNNPKKYVGVSIDIVPLIGIPNDKKECDYFVQRLKKFHEEGMMFDRYGLLNKFKSKQALEQEQKYLLSANKFGTTNYIMDFSDPRYILKSIGFENPDIMKFEDTDIPVSSNYRDDLTIQYGEYQKYPPEDKRKNVHQDLSMVNLNKSCLEYAKGFDKMPTEIKNIIKVQHKFEGYCEKGISQRDKIIDDLNLNYKTLSDENKELRHKITKLETKPYFRWRKFTKDNISKIKNKISKVLL